MEQQCCCLGGRFDYEFSQQIYFSCRTRLAAGILTGNRCQIQGRGLTLARGEHIVSSCRLHWTEGLARFTSRDQHQAMLHPMVQGSSQLSASEGVKHKTTLHPMVQGSPWLSTSEGVTHQQVHQAAHCPAQARSLSRHGSRQWWQALRAAHMRQEGLLKGRSSCRV